jgi:hypothetical protein
MCQPDDFPPYPHNVMLCEKPAGCLCPCSTCHQLATGIGAGVRREDDAINARIPRDDRNDPEA